MGMEMSRSRTARIDGSTAGIALYAGVYCAVTGCLAFGFYQLMQPTRIANPGLAAYQPGANRMANFTSGARLPVPADPVPVASEPAPETTAGLAAQSQPEMSKSNPAKAETPKPQRAQRPERRRERRSPFEAFAYQPFYGGPITSGMRGSGRWSWR